MNRIYVSVLIIMVSLLPVGTACNNTSTESQENNQLEQKTVEPAVRLVNLDAPADGQKFKSGDDIEVQLSLSGDANPDSVRVYFDGSLLFTMKAETLNYGLSTSGSRLGIIPLKIMAYRGSRRPQVITHFVTLLSDIVPGVQGYTIVKSYPHDENAYTQGLVYYDGYLLESTGQEGESSLRKVEIETGRVRQMHSIERKFFGEGIVPFNNQVYMLTWKDNVGFVFDLESFTELRRIHYDSQGWGLTTDGEQLIMSDGTNKIYYLEPEYFTVKSSIEVYDDKDAVWQLNELEYINGEIWANIYTTDRLVRIDPRTGKVLSYIDLSGLLTEKEYVKANELNGIAWDKVNRRLFVTGKDWPRLFEIKIKGLELDSE